ncbi:hypothetical protein [Shewanella phaeophyticola]|uniref:Uncharacterized protein n=1 Tax=Shewanella phaeophyticola TaxID=2978345 RepID=A0ABT2P6E6_9GAMM|nr:hypothetical protein [Shewanella sp. KJ10-1]MCT8987469.1 hypothetical protein [Shewanella sp. KJ10-1]
MTLNHFWRSYSLISIAMLTLSAPSFAHETKQPTTQSKSEADLKQWPVTMAKVQAQFTEAKMVVPGHGKIGDTSLLSHTIDLLTQ